MDMVSHWNSVALVGGLGAAGSCFMLIAEGVALSIVDEVCQIDVR